MRVLLLINARVDEQTRRLIAAGDSPRKDYLELLRALDADMLDLAALENQRWTRLIRQFLGPTVAQSLLALTRVGRYDAVFADRETTGLALAGLARLRGRRPRLTMIGHLLSPRSKRIVFRALRLNARIDRVIVHSSLQERIALRGLGLRSDQVALVPYQCDERFWAPRDVPLKNQICSVGLEYRDYDTLLDAVEGLDVDVVIGAASHWSKHRAHIESHDRVRVAAFDYSALRQLYAESLFVVVPLHDIKNQAGITVILEAMAMGKAVIVSHTHGQVDVVRDRRRLNRVDPDRQTQPDWARRLGASDSVAHGQTGIYVMPGDAHQLRQAIAFLLHHPEQARIMGANGRRVLEATMSLDHFTERLAAIIRGDSAPAGVPVTSTRSVHAGQAEA